MFDNFVKYYIETFMRRVELSARAERGCGADAVLTSRIVAYSFHLRFVFSRALQFLPLFVSSRTIQLFPLFVSYSSVSSAVRFLSCSSISFAVRFNFLPSLYLTVLHTQTHTHSLSLYSSFSLSLRFVKQEKKNKTIDSTSKNITLYVPT